MKEARRFFNAVVYKNRIYVFGGHRGSGGTKSVERYN